MGKFNLFSYAVVGCMSLLSLGASAQKRMAPAATANKVVRLTPKVAAKHQPTSTSTPMKASYSQYDLLVDEDFSLMTDGTEDEPDTTECLASETEDPGIYVDPAYTHQAGWAGDNVFSAGGAVCLRTFNIMKLAVLYTPLGDYSGEITVTCRAKALPAKTLGTDESGRTVWQELTGSTLYIQAGIGGLENGTLAKTDDSGTISTRLYPKQGWTYVTYTFKNYSGNDDGFIAFSTEGNIVLDDIRITTSPTIMGMPGDVRATDFQPTKLSIAWQPVRKAYNYYVNLYKKVYTSDSDETFTEDFESDKPNDGWYFSSYNIAENEGKDGSDALLLNNGDTIVTPYNGTTYKNFKFWMKAVYPEGMAYEDKTGTVGIDLLTAKGWKNLTVFYGEGFSYDGYYDCDMNEEAYDLFKNGSYYGVRLTPVDFPAEAKLYLDAIEIPAGRPFELQFVKGRNSSDYGMGDDYTKYDDTEDTTYTFTGLDPKSDYFFGVRSHYVDVFSQWNLIEASRGSLTDITDVPLSAGNSLATDGNARGKVSEIFSLDGRRMPNLRQGLNIVRMSDGTVRKVFYNK